MLHPATWLDQSQSANRRRERSWHKPSQDIPTRVKRGRRTRILEGNRRCHKSPACLRRLKTRFIQVFFRLNLKHLLRRQSQPSLHEVNQRFTSGWYRCLNRKPCRPFTSAYARREHIASRETQRVYRRVHNFKENIYGRGSQRIISRFTTYSHKSSSDEYGNVDHKWLNSWINGI